MSSPASDSPPSTAHGRAELTWEIENFLTTIDVKRSPIFSFPPNSKVRFLLECSPFVDIAGQTGKFVLFNLCLDPSNRSGIRVLLVKPVRYRIAILGTKGTKHFSQECQNEFANPNTRFGVIGGYQIERNYLLEPKNGLLNNDKFTVYCEVDDSCLKESLAIPPNPIQDDFRSLLKSGKYSDVVLLIDGKSLSVHKNILAARSDVFAAMFEHDLEEKKTNRVDITDVAIEVMELMLDFIYTGEIPRLRGYATELFVAADKYQLNVLRKSCEDYLIGHLKTKTVANILMTADMHQASDLKEASSVYITENVKQVMQTEGWKVLLTKSDLIDELFAKMADEKDIRNEKPKTSEFDAKKRDKSKYQLNHLKAKCEKSLSFSIDVGSVVDKFLLAETNEANHLKRICFDFICENVKQVILTEGWKTLKQVRPQFAFELLEQVTEKKW